MAEEMHESEAVLLHLVHLQFGSQGHSRVGLMALTAMLVRDGTITETLGTTHGGKGAGPCALAFEIVLGDGDVRELDTGIDLDGCFLRVLSYIKRPDNRILLKNSINMKKMSKVSL